MQIWYLSLLNTFHWCSLLRTELEFLRVARCAPPPLSRHTPLLYLAALTPCSSRVSCSQLPKAPGSCTPISFAGDTFPLVAHFAASSFLFILPDSAQHHLLLKASLGFYSSPSIWISALRWDMSWSISVSSVELSVLICKLLEGRSCFLFSLGSLVPNIVPAHLINERLLINFLIQSSSVY